MSRFTWVKIKEPRTCKLTGERTCYDIIFDGCRVVAVAVSEEQAIADCALYNETAKRAAA